MTDQAERMSSSPTPTGNWLAIAGFICALSSLSLLVLWVALILIPDGVPIDSDDVNESPFAALALALLLAPLGLALSIAGIARSNSLKAPRRGLAIAGVAIATLLGLPLLGSLTLAACSDMTITLSGG